MELNTILAGTGTTGTILTILYFIYKAVNGKRCHSRCCNRNIDAEFKVDNISPNDKKKDAKFDTKEEVKVTIPK